APAVGAVARARAVKGPYEIDCLAQALRIAEEAIHAVLGELRAGTTERDAVALYERAVATRAATPYATIIAFGAHAALPAAPTGERALRPGELVRFDVGSIFKGYHGEVARMAILGEPESRALRAYDAVEAGVQAALETIRPGVDGGKVFEAAVAAVRDGGLPEFRRHHVGHGIGLEPGQAPPYPPTFGPPRQSRGVPRPRQSRGSLDFALGGFALRHVLLEPALRLRHAVRLRLVSRRERFARHRQVDRPRVLGRHLLNR